MPPVGYPQFGSWVLLVLKWHMETDSRSRVYRRATQHNPFYSYCLWCLSYMSTCFSRKSSLSILRGTGVSPSRFDLSTVVTLLLFWGVHLFIFWLSYGKISSADSTLTPRSCSLQSPENRRLSYLCGLSSAALDGYYPPLPIVPWKLHSSSLCPLRTRTTHRSHFHLQISLQVRRKRCCVLPVTCTPVQDVCCGLTERGYTPDGQMTKSQPWKQSHWVSLTARESLFWFWCD